MKKSIILAVIATCLCGNFSVVNAGMFGDIDNDGSVSLADAILALQLVSGLTSDAVNKEADVNGDGKVDMLDWEKGQGKRI